MNEGNLSQDMIDSKPTISIVGEGQCLPPRALVSQRQYFTGLIRFTVDAAGEATLFDLAATPVVLLGAGQGDPAENAGGGTDDVHDVSTTSLYEGGFFVKTGQFEIESVELGFLKPYTIDGATVATTEFFANGAARDLVNAAYHGGQLIQAIERQCIIQAVASDQGGNALIGPLSFLPQQTGIGNSDTVVNGVAMLGNSRQLPVNVIVESLKSDIDGITFNIITGAFEAAPVQTEETTAGIICVPVRLVVVGRPINQQSA